MCVCVFVCVCLCVCVLHYVNCLYNHAWFFRGNAAIFVVSINAADMANLYTKASAQLDANPRVHRVVLIMDKLSASRHFKYLFIDDAKQVILPRVGHLTWPRLQGVVGFRVAVLKNCMYVIGGKDKQSGKASNQVTAMSWWAYDHILTEYC